MSQEDKKEMSYLKGMIEEMQESETKKRKRKTSSYPFWRF